MSPVTPSTILTRNPDLIATEMDGDLVMMSIEQGEYYGLGGVGPRVWDLLAAPISTADITRAICVEYAVDEATCRTDMQAFIAELMRLGLVTPA